MDRVVRLNRLWSWLPAFRAVAETEHLHQAAGLLHLTPSTLSRAVHQLEDDVGQLLFRRHGRSIELSDAGRILLTALRDAMRRLDDALAAIGADAASGPLRIACGDAAAMGGVLAAVDDAARAGSAFPLPQLSIPSADTAADLLRGSIDIAFVTSAHEHPLSVVSRVGLLRYSVYCGPSHALAGVALERDDIGSYPFVEAEGLPWAPELPRLVGMRLPGAALAVAACARGSALAMLPDAVAHGLVRVVCSDGQPLATMAEPLYAVHRRALSTGHPIAFLVAAVRARLQAVEQPVANNEMDLDAATA